jgi:hypothetical protein
MPAAVKKIVASQPPGWAKWFVFAAAVLVTKNVIKSLSALIATEADFGSGQREALRELFRM